MRTVSPSTALLLVSLFFFETACSGSGVSDGSLRDRNVITAEEIRDQVQAENIYDVVRNLRPHWLRTRGANDLKGETRIWVYVDGMQFGEIESLRRLAVGDAGTIRHLNASAATLRYGQNHTQGVIEVTTRR